MLVKTHGIKINLNGVGGLRTCIHLQEHRATNLAERLRRALPRLPGAGRQGPRAASPGAIVKGEHACRSARAATATGFATSCVRPAFRMRSGIWTPRRRCHRGRRGRRTKKLSEIAEARNSKRAAAAPLKKHASRRIFPPPGGVRNVPTCFLILGGSHLAISASPESQGSSIPVEARVEGSSAIARSPFSEALFSFAFSFAR